MQTLTMTTVENIATITINSPPANALSGKLLDDLAVELDEIEKDKTIKVIVIKGEGKFFSAGADIKEFTGLQDAGDYEILSRKGQQLFERMTHFSLPIIAAIHGAALGGGLELAMACHIRIVGENAKLGLPELSLGIIPGFAGTQRLPRYVGTAKAYEMVLSSKPITGREAHVYGLANRSVADDRVEQEAVTLAKKVASQSKPTITRIMKLISYTHDGDILTGARKEAEAFGEVFGTADAHEGIQAFLEKRNPIFKDE